MPELAGAAVVRELLSVLREALDGSSGPSSYFIENRQDTGLFGSLAALSAAEASRPWSGTTIAAHVHHVAFGMEASADGIEGDETPRDWSESWRVTTVDEASWRQLVDQLRRQYEKLRRAVESRALTSEDAFGGALGAIAHIAYHLGAIRQKVVGLRAH